METNRERLKVILKENSILLGKFKLSSGKESDYYIDARLTTLHAEGVYLVGKIFLDEILKDSDIQAVGGPTMGADPIVGSIIALSYQSVGAALKPVPTLGEVKGRSLRGFLVRKEEKQHGTGKLIEGNLRAGDKVAVVEDVATTGRSILKAIDAVENEGAWVKKVLVIVDREEGAREKFEDMGYEFFSIFRIKELL
ncbi:MAG: orotate phosphoribosyltransferase [Deltaproteobacteria bacterium]|nr:orotate phosphoribosyltransferase [Deltaproteobacteria bacterium]